MRKIKRKMEPGALQHLEPHIVIIYLLYDMDRNIYLLKRLIFTNDDVDPRYLGLRTLDPSIA